MIKVVKFGGSSLADAVQIKKAGKIVLSEESRRYVVPSAPGKRFSDDTKVTDMLYRCYGAAVKEKKFTELLADIQKRYQEIIEGLGITLSLDEEFATIRDNFAKKIGKPDPEEYINDGGWKARQGGNGLEAAQTSVVSFEPCATEEKAFNYELQRPITEELYELFKPFGYINKDLGNKRLGEVFVLNKAGKVVLILQGRLGSTKLKVTIKDIHIAKSRTLSAAEGKIQCQITKYQMCLGCKACESVCKYDAISVKDDGTGKIIYSIDNRKCKRCTECVGHFNGGCYMRKVLGIKRT